jgi:hypothetical protein
MPTHPLPFETGVRSCVENTNSDVIGYLSKTFKTNMFFHSGRAGNLICPCVKANVPFQIIQYLEFSLDSAGSSLGILEPGNYEIAFHDIDGPVHIIRLKKFDQNWKEIAIIDGVYAGWDNNQMIDWGGIIPVQGEFSF